MLLRRSTLFVSGLLALGLAIGGCAAPGPSAAGEEAFNDPLEDTNRAIFGMNQAIDRNVLLPVAKTYRTVLIPPMRQAFHDFMQNLNAPVVFANDVLQGQFGLAANTLGRVLVNTSMGMGGMFTRHPVRHPLSQQRSWDHVGDLGLLTTVPIWCCRCWARPTRAT